MSRQELLKEAWVGGMVGSMSGQKHAKPVGARKCALLGECEKFEAESVESSGVVAGGKRCRRQAPSLQNRVVGAWGPIRISQPLTITMSRMKNVNFQRQQP